MVPNRNDMKKKLAECVEVPKPGTPLALIVGFNDPVYCERKAIELIAEVHLMDNGIKAYVPDHTYPDEVARTWEGHDRLKALMDEKVKMAIYLLTVSRIQRAAK